MPAYDIIGDVHGADAKLEGLLDALGYVERGGAYRLDGHQALFVGDLIDRGDGQVRVLEVVRAMVDAGSARMVMGNHEFNALAWATPHPERPGDSLRTRLGPRGQRNRAQHQSFLDQVVEGSALHASTMDWFRTLPLWLDLDALRVVHACWHPWSLGVLDKWVGSGEPVSDEFLLHATTPGTDVFDAVDIVLKGPEVHLTRELAWRDRDGTPRWAARIRWWDDAATSLGDLADIPAGSPGLDGAPHPGLPDIATDVAAGFRYTDAVPVFFGHYWFRGDPRPAGRYAVCTDYSAARDDRPLVAYRWNGESRPTTDRFVSYAGRP